MELFAIICLALIMASISVFVVLLWYNTTANDGAMVFWAIVLTVISATIITWLGYWLIIWGGQYFINMGWHLFEQ